jgi:hypothetical protein
VTRRRVVGAGVVALSYVGLALVSAWLSPIARRPVLDGLAPIAPYRWVSPPPELADGNQPPAVGTFEIRLAAGGSEPGVFITTDNQVTVVVDRGQFPPRERDRSVRLTVTPLDPATLGALPGELTAFGNALELRATYEPSGKPARVAEPLRFIAVYPTTQTLHATTHEILRSDDGQTWTALASRDAPGIQQVEASVTEAGFLVVAGELTPIPAITTPAADDTDPLIVILLVVSAAAMLVGAAFLVRGGRAK